MSGSWPSVRGGFKLTSFPNDLTTSSLLYLYYVSGGCEKNKWLWWAYMAVENDTGNEYVLVGGIWILNVGRSNKQLPATRAILKLFHIYSIKTTSLTKANHFYYLSAKTHDAGIRPWTVYEMALTNILNWSRPFNVSCFIDNITGPKSSSFVK